MKIAIIIPAYNEEKRIGKTLEEYANFFNKKRKSKGFDYEILVVINNTSDKTKEVVKKKQLKEKRIKYLDLKHGGKGYAVIEGFKSELKKRNNLIGFVDADLATAPEEFYKLIESMKENDGAIASRYISGAEVRPRFTFRRLFVGKIFNFFVRSLFFIPLHDTQCGAKVFSREAAEIIANEVKTSRWAFDVEIIYTLYSHNLRIIEVPTLWNDARGSKLNIVKSSIQMFFAILRLRIIKSKFRRLFLTLKPLMGLVWRLTN